MVGLKVIKINRGEYNLIDDSGNSLFQYPVSKHEANMERQNIEVFERMLTHEGINKVVQKFINVNRWKISEYGSCDQVIRNYARELYHSDMRKMMQKPYLFYAHLLAEHAKNKAAREASRIDNQ